MRTNRRKFFAKAGVSAAALTLATSQGAAAAPAQTRTRASGLDKDGPILKIGDTIAVADTAYGKVRGYILRDIHYFLGVPYGADTSGANRFMPPQKPKPWTDIRPTLWWGNTAPQNMDNRYASQYGSFRDHWNYDDVSEDCLRLNVFTPALKDGKKRPVMFWIHGGGYTNGNAHRARRLQRREPRAVRRRRLRVDQPPPRSARLLQPRRRRRREVLRVGQRRSARHRRRARVGARQHRQLRRRPGQRHDHGPVGRRREGVRAVGDALGQGPVPQGRRAERRLGAGRRQGHGREARELRARRSRPAGRRDRQAAADAVEAGTTRSRPRRSASWRRSWRRPGRRRAACGPASARRWTARSCRSTRSRPRRRRPRRTSR